MSIHQGKTALVTGGSGGLGRAISELLVREGANVVVCDIKKDLLDDFREKVSSAYPDRTLAVECNVTSEPAVDDLFAQIAKQFKHLDYVVNCAGVMDKFAPVGDVEKELWDKVIATNLTAPMMVTKRAVNMMLEAKVQGAIVNIASTAGFRGFYAGTAYTASKHGMIGLTKSTGAFYADKGIRANAIAVGQMRTNIMDGLVSGINMDGLNYHRKRHPHAATEAHWYCDLDKTAKLVVYLLSSDAEMINGAVYTADAGATAD